MMCLAFGVRVRFLRQQAPRSGGLSLARLFKAWLKVGNLSRRVSDD